MYSAGIPVACLIADREDSVTIDSFLKAVKLWSPTTMYLNQHSYDR